MILEIQGDAGEFNRFLGALQAESDRGAALIAAARLDTLLEEILSKIVVQHSQTKELAKGSGAPLATFSSRIIACLAMGIISLAEATELQIIRRIRNDFAHTVYVDFQDQSIRDKCGNLKYFLEGSTTARLLFLTSASVLVGILGHKLLFAEECRFTLVQWPERNLYDGSPAPSPGVFQSGD